MSDRRDPPVGLFFLNCSRSRPSRNRRLPLPICNRASLPAPRNCPVTSPQIPRPPLHFPSISPPIRAPRLRNFLAEVRTGHRRVSSNHGEQNEKNIVYRTRRRLHHLGRLAALFQGVRVHATATILIVVPFLTPLTPLSNFSAATSWKTRSTRISPAWELFRPRPVAVPGSARRRHHPHTPRHDAPTLVVKFPKPGSHGNAITDDLQSSNAAVFHGSGDMHHRVLVNVVLAVRSDTDDHD